MNAITTRMAYLKAANKFEVELSLFCVGFTDDVDKLRVMCFTCMQLTIRGGVHVERYVRHTAIACLIV